MDSCPMHNQLNVDLSIQMNDSVMAQGTDNGTRAASDGTVQAFTSATREYHLYNGYVWVARQLLERTGKQFTAYAQGLVVQTAATSVAVGGAAVPGNFLYPLTLVKSDNTEYEFDYIPPFRKVSLDTDSLPDVMRAFTVLGGKVFVYERAGVLSQITSGLSFILTYVKAERIDPANGARLGANSAPDITLDRQWQEAALLYAAYKCSLDKGDTHWTEIGKGYLQDALLCLPQAAK